MRSRREQRRLREAAKARARQTPSKVFGPRILPNLAQPLSDLRAAPHESHTFGLPPQTWWLLFRRDLLHLHAIHRMNDRQWQRALLLGAHRRLRPVKAAKEVAALTSLPSIG